MPDLDYAVLCEFARIEPGGLVHLISGGIDTIEVEKVPHRATFSLAVNVLFARSECERPHRLELKVQGYDGEEIGTMTGTTTPKWPSDFPGHWKTPSQVALNFGFVIPAFSEYSVDVLINDSLAKTIPFRVIQRASE